MCVKISPPQQLSSITVSGGRRKKIRWTFYSQRFVAGELDNQSFANIARAMGAEGITVNRLEDVGTALKTAIDAQMNDHKTTVVEIMCTQELGDPFRRDAHYQSRFATWINTKNTSEPRNILC